MLCFVHGQVQKIKQKPSTRKFSGFHKHSTLTRHASVKTLSFFSCQILHSEPPTLGNKFKDWASSKWNLLDGFAVVSFFVGLGLRLHPTTRSAGHVVYCLDVMLWIIRLLDIFSVSKHLGPYVVMIGRMVM